jgi:hypothetical protein
MPRRQIRPPIKLRKKFAPLIVLCRNKILTAVPQTSGSALGDKAITIVLKWAVKDGVIDRPKDFPRGKTLDSADEWVVQKHDVKVLLEYFHSRGYITYTAATLFAARLPILMRLAKLELGLERSVDITSCDAFLQHVEQELLAGSKDSVYNGRIE